MILVPAKTNTGWAVHFVPVWLLLPHEQHFPERAKSLARTIQEVGVWTTPILIERDYKIILDGHHRFTAANILNLSMVPAVVIPYNDQRLSLHSWREGKKWSPNEVIDTATKGMLLPAKSTKHVLVPDVGRVDFDIDQLKKN